MRTFANGMRSWKAVALPLLVGLLAVVQVGAQEKATPGKADAKPAAKETKSTGRLPAYYGQVVSKEQRTKIYDIQAKYGEQIKTLRDQIMALEKQQMDEVVGVLSTEQRDQVAKMVADAKAKRSKKTDAPGESTPSGDGDSGK